jgi:tRNA(Arg) A34 adenosine deaminase TadA
VKDGKIVFENENQIHTASDPTFHAELGLIRRFCSQQGTEDLRDYTLYTSCEPCMMCSGAMVWAKLGRMVYGASNIDLENILHKTGHNTSELTFTEMGRGPKTTGGVLRDASYQVLAAYFG